MTKTFNHASRTGNRKSLEGKTRTESPAKDETPAGTEASERHAQADRHHVRHGHLRIHRLPPLSVNNGNEAGSRSRELKPHLRAIAESIGIDARTLRKELSGMKRNARKTEAANSHSRRPGSKTTRFEHVRRAFRNVTRAILGAKHTPSTAS